MPGQSAAARHKRRHEVAVLADSQSGVLGRRQLYAHGWTYAQVEAQIHAGRWRRAGDMTVITHTGLPDRRGLWWRAVLEVGPTSAIAGVTALVAAGLTGVTDGNVHVAAPKSARPRHVPGVVVHETRRLRADDIITAGLPRLRPAPAAVLGSLWAPSERQAALFLVVAVQQRLTSAADLAVAASRVRRSPRRTLLHGVVADLAGGAESLGELDFATLCRAAGLPEPSRQRVVQRPGGRYYLDVEWEEWSLAAEIDGVAHMSVATWVDDAWRQNDVVIGGRTVLRFPQLAVRLHPDRVIAQTTAALVRRGWRPGLRRAR